MNLKKMFIYSINSIICIILLIVFIIPIARATVLDRIVAIVNDEIILYSDLMKEIEFIKKNSPNGIALPESVLEKEILQRMVQEKLIEQEMKRLKIQVDDAEVDLAIERIKQSSGWTDDQFQYVLQQQGMSVEDFRKEIRQEMERTRLIDRVFQSRTIITDDQIEAYLREHGGQLASGRVKLSIIFIPKENRINKSAEDILKEIRNGADFYELARKYSKGPGADQGGRIGWIGINELTEALREEVRGLLPGQVSSVISMDAGDFIVRLEDRETYTSAGGVTEGEKEKVRRLLLKQEVDKKFREWMQKLVEQSYVKITL